MPIDTGRNTARKQVAWYGEPAPADARTAFEDRDFLVIDACTDANLEDPSFISGVSAVIFTQDRSKQLQIGSPLKAHAKRLLDFDCRIILRPVRDDDQIISNVLESLQLAKIRVPPIAGRRGARQGAAKTGIPPLPYIRQFGPATQWREIANFVVDSPTGPPPNLALQPSFEQPSDVSSEVRSVDESAESKLLLQRAFFDCTDVHLTPLDGGRSKDVRVYKACVELSGIVGNWPLPYFVKIGDRDKIYEEFKNYQEFVDPYIPFHLGPHLIDERCCLGASEGVIVGDYVDESESLRYCAYDGRSASAIACLFDRTLLGWHRLAKEVDVPFSLPLLSRFPRKISASRWARAQSLGATTELSTLRELFQKCIAKPVLVGHIHGDLHAANVRVRATEAVVIDFLAHRGDLPLLCDAATLEASLLVEGFSVRETDIDGWIESVESLYDHPPLDPGVSPMNPKSKAFWFHACVMQIRRYARQWAFGDEQYAAALALALVTKAVKDRDAPEPEASRRAAAYLFAEWILTKTFGTSAPDIAVEVAS